MVFVYGMIESRCSFTIHCISHFIWIRRSNLYMVFLFRNSSSISKKSQESTRCNCSLFRFLQRIGFLCMYKLHWFSAKKNQRTKLLFTIILREPTNAISIWFKRSVAAEAQIPSTIERKLSGKLSRCCFSHRPFWALQISSNWTIVQFYSIPKQPMQKA